MGAGAGRVSNRERSDVTRARLLEAARARFAREGWATPMPAVVADAGLTRGALYHHFTDKRHLFRAVVEREHAAVAAAIEAASADATDPLDAVRAGGEAFLDAMDDAGRRRILLVDAPAVLGTEELARIEAGQARRTLAEGLAAAADAGLLRDDVPLDALTDLLDAAFDRAALAGGPRSHREALAMLLEGLRRSPERRPADLGPSARGTRA